MLLYFVGIFVHRNPAICNSPLETVHGTLHPMFLFEIVNCLSLPLFLPQSSVRQSIQSFRSACSRCRHHYHTREVHKALGEVVVALYNVDLRFSPRFQTWAG